jgi:hypothetical protein
MVMLFGYEAIRIRTFRLLGSSLASLHPVWPRQWVPHCTRNDPAVQNCSDARVVSVRSGVEGGSSSRPKTKTDVLWGRARPTHHGMFPCKVGWFCFNPDWIDGDRTNTGSMNPTSSYLYGFVQLHSSEIIPAHSSSLLAGFRVTSLSLLQPFFFFLGLPPDSLSYSEAPGSTQVLSSTCTPHPFLLLWALLPWCRPPHQPSPESLRVSPRASLEAVMLLR